MRYSRRNFLAQILPALGFTLMVDKSINASRIQISNKTFSSLFADKLEGAIYGAAIADGMGASVEGWPPDRIKERFANVNDFLPPTHDEDPRQGKGDGRITDDTLLVEALIRAYINCKDHMDAYDYAKYFIPEIAEREVWIPERQQNCTVLDRPLWWAEKYPWIRIVQNNVEPRSAGRGNMVNCGVAIFMLPIGAVNAGDPPGAYQEATSFALAHNDSFALEAGGVTAAAFAEAFKHQSSIESTLSVAKKLSKDGTHAAIDNVLEVVNPEDDLEIFIEKVHSAFIPYYGLEYDKLSDRIKWEKESVTNIKRPSRISSIEELPIALAALKYGNGDFHKTLKSAIFYGRDTDSIATIALGIYGAIFGIKSIPSNLKKHSNQANRRDFSRTADDFLEVVYQIMDKDLKRINDRQSTLYRS